MKIKEVTIFLEDIAPLGSQESYDNCGLLVGDPNTEITGALLTLDCIESTVDEAISLGYNLIIAHHPIIFGGLKKLNGKNYIERTVLKAIKNDIAIYAIHTNLDNYNLGVNYEIGQRLGLENLKVLAPKKEVLNKLVVYVPKNYTDEVKTALYKAGAGNIGNYAECSFQTEGIGTFTPLEDADPFIGTHQENEKVEESKVEVIVDNYKLSKVIAAMLAAHPYEEVAYDVFALKNQHQQLGSGMFGELAHEMETKDFLAKVKSTFNCGVIRHTHIHKETIKKVAFCGGSGSFLLGQAKGVGADIYITGDFKYHEFFDAENQIIIADIGHFESEQYTPHLLERILKKKFINFAVRLTGVNTNPINYF